MPWRRKHWIRVVMEERDDAAQEQQSEAARAAEHAQAMARRGLNPDGTKLGS